METSLNEYLICSGRISLPLTNQYNIHLVQILSLSKEKKLKIPKNNNCYIVSRK